MKRIVIKVGTAVLTQDSHIAEDRLANIVKLLIDLKKRYEVVLVSSGAVSAGYTQLKLDKKILQNKQALAAIGQPLLMKKYRLAFAEHNELCAQILLTAANLNTPNQNEKIKNTMNILLENGVVPIVNENDATATDELGVGDNDQLSAYVSCNINADMLIILSDIDAYYDSDPHKNSDAKVRKVVRFIDECELQQCASPNSEFATGGIVTKLKAASYMLTCEREMFLASGFNLEDVRSFLIDDKHLGGTLFTCKEI
ncbi:glutamate 5-kinase [Sulfurimonas sp. HSL-1716]|uniref:glutamate 5-kinase n=1 Tax=Hydrocurvibacter sulfurireducens TaxID=3131937 RepID=UPI0031F9725A